MGQMYSKLTSQPDPRSVSKPEKNLFLSLPWDVREQIIFWCYHTPDNYPFADSVIRIQGEPLVCRSGRALQNAIYVLKWVPQSDERTCKLALVNRQLNDECEEVLFKKFVFVLDSGLNKASIDNFVGSFSFNAKHRLRRVAVQFHLPISPIDTLMDPSMALSNPYDEIRPEGILSSLWDALPNLKNMDVYIQPSRNPKIIGGNDWIFNLRFFQEVWTFLATFQPDREDLHKDAPPLSMNILCPEENLGLKIPIIGNSVGEKIIIQDMPFVRMIL